VVDECRILASRERCPYLVHVEVAETGLRGNDPRLYASGAPGLGATINEALAMSASAAGPKGSTSQEQVFAPYHIPSELLETSFSRKTKKANNLTTAQEDFRIDARMQMPRGGWQANETAFYASNPDDVFVSNPYDTVRETEYQELHEQMYSEHGLMVQHSDISEQRYVSFIVAGHCLACLDTSCSVPSLVSLRGKRRFHSTREALLDRVFGQPWNEKCEEIRQASPYGKVHGWRLASFIVKAGEDIRREALVMQIINKLSEWFQTDIPESHRPHMRPYTIMCVGGEAGLVECLSDAKSVDEVKKKTDGFQSLRDYFERAYGPPTTRSNHYQRNSATSIYPGRKETRTFEQAQDNFLRSLVGYSLVCYILQIKDRHNANILLDREGNIMHIDFGFVLGDTPKMAKVPIFSERAPFKLSQEFWDVLGGWNIKQGGLGVRFCHMFEHAFACAASHTEEIVSLVEATMLTLTQSPRQARFLANGVRNRLRMRGAPGSSEQKTFIMELINAALIDFGTSAYDWLQRNMNGYQ
jgi:phosphatidylinositol 4-kinase A